LQWIVSRGDRSQSVSRCLATKNGSVTIAGRSVPNCRPRMLMDQRVAKRMPQQTTRVEVLGSRGAHVMLESSQAWSRTMRVRIAAAPLQRRRQQNERAAAPRNWQESKFNRKKKDQHRSQREIREASPKSVKTPTARSMYAAAVRSSILGNGDPAHTTRATKQLKRCGYRSKIIWPQALET